MERRLSLRDIWSYRFSSTANTLLHMKMESAGGFEAGTNLLPVSYIGATALIHTHTHTYKWVVLEPSMRRM